ncbi:MAG: biosis protein MshQ [Myxococcaceae bacterium]|nr:biosis protein MshQ [Myxococcaceae bacterium]
MSRALRFRCLGLWLAWGCWLAGCVGSEEPATGALVAIHADVELATRIKVLKARLFALDAGDGATPSQELSFAITDQTRRGTGDVVFPFSFGVQKGAEPGFLLLLAGFADGQSEPLIEQKVRVRFEPRQTVLVEAFLRSACLAHVCSALAQTCSADTAACIPVPDAVTRAVVPGGEFGTSRTPVFDAGDASSAAPESGVEPSGPADAGPEASAPDAAPVPVPDAGVRQSFHDDLTLWLRMEEAAWSLEPGQVRDDSGQGNRGNALGTANTTPRGRVGRAAQLDGTGWVEVPDHPSLRPATAFTVSAWFQLDQLPGMEWPGVVCKRLAYGSETSYAIFLSPNNHITIDVAGEESRFDSNAVVSVGAWQHVALVFDGTLPVDERVRLYVDGVLDVTRPEPSSEVPSFAAQVSIGTLPNGGSVFHGRIDEVAFWRRALRRSPPCISSQPCSERRDAGADAASKARSGS